MIKMIKIRDCSEIERIIDLVSWIEDSPYECYMSWDEFAIYHLEYRKTPGLKIKPVGCYLCRLPIKENYTVLVKEDDLGEVGLNLHNLCCGSKRGMN
ncbi:MAG: hypothetical protein ABIJ18_05890 [archaeon]